MNTEPTINIQSELIQIHSQFGMTELANYRIEKLFEEYAKTIQPKIQQLEWDFYGTYYSAKTPVGNYVILEGDELYLENYTACSLTYNGNLIADFDSIKEAQSAAQTDFEQRVKECLL